MLYRMDKDNLKDAVGLSQSLKTYTEQNLDQDNLKKSHYKFRVVIQREFARLNKENDSCL